MQNMGAEQNKRRFRATPNTTFRSESPLIWQPGLDFTARIRLAALKGLQGGRCRLRSALRPSMACE